MNINQQWRRYADSIVRQRAQGHNPAQGDMDPIVKRVLKYSQIKPGNKPVALADANLTPDTVRFVQKQGIAVIDIKLTELAQESDKVLFAYARRNVLLLLTHDHDFLNTKRFDYSKSPGVVLLPTPKEAGISYSPHDYEPLRLSLVHLTRTMHNAAKYFGTLQEYGRDGRLIAHQPPTKLRENLTTVGTWQAHDYFNVTAGQEPKKKPRTVHKHKPRYTRRQRQAYGSRHSL